MYKTSFIEQILNYFSHKLINAEYNGNVLNNTDRSLLFVNSGIAANYKRILESDREYVTVQKCIRLSGKHNDLNMIGNSPIHASCFHMLGVFAHGAEFLRPVIQHIFNFLFDFAHISKESLICTIDRSYPSHIYKMLEEMNIQYRIEDSSWEMNDKVSGICMEIFYKQCGEEDIEIFNIVYIYNEQTDSYIIDSGAGVERLYKIMYKKDNIFAFDDYRGNHHLSTVDRIRITDFVITISTILEAGIPYGNTQQSYILKKMLRTLMLDLKEKNIDIRSLDLQRACIDLDALYNLLDYEIEMFNRSLRALQDYIVKKSLTYLNKEDLIYLHTTRGVIYDMIGKSLAMINMNIDYDQTLTFEEIVANNNIKIEDYSSMPNISKYSEDLVEAKSKIIAVIDSERNTTYKIHKGVNYKLIVELNIFYPHNLGAQVSDKGSICTEDDVELFTVEKMVNIKGVYVLEVISQKNYTLTENMSIKQKIDTEHRTQVMRAHTGHHIILVAIKNVAFGPVVQASSYIDVKNSHITVFYRNNIRPTIRQLNAMLDAYTEEKNKVSKSIRPFSTINRNIVYLSNAYYPNQVTVVSIANDNESWISTEVCGGLHVKNSSEIKNIRIVDLMNVNPFTTKYYFEVE